MNILQRLHGDYIVKKGQVVEPNTIIGYGNGHGPNVEMASHDHISVGKASNSTHNGGYDGCNNTDNPMNYLQGINNNDVNAHFVFNQSMGGGGYGYLEQTPYTGYTDCRDNSLHDGIDFFAPKGAKLYAGVYGVVTDVGYQNNGLTYCYIEIKEMNERGKTPMEKAKIDFSKKTTVIKFNGGIGTFDKNGNRLNDTPVGGWARADRLNNGWVMCTGAHGEVFYITEDNYLNHADIELVG